MRLTSAPSFHQSTAKPSSHTNARSGTIKLYFLGNDHFVKPLEEVYTKIAYNPTLLDPIEDFKTSSRPLIQRTLFPLNMPKTQHVASISEYTNRQNPGTHELLVAQSYLRMLAKLFSTEPSTRNKGSGLNAFAVQHKATFDQAKVRKAFQTINEQSYEIGNRQLVRREPIIDSNGTVMGFRIFAPSKLPNLLAPRELSLEGASEVLLRDSDHLGHILENLKSSNKLPQLPPAD
jgi:hypothetical protein